MNTIPDSIFRDKPQQFSSYTREDNAKLVFARIPTFEFLIQRFTLPGISLGTVQLGGRTGAFSRPGEILSYEKPLNLEIILDENYIGFQEIYDWMELIGSDEDPIERDFQTITTDARIVITNNNRDEEVGSFLFKDVYPIGMSSISYGFSNGNPSPLKFNASFDYSIWKPDFSKNRICKN